MIKFSNYLNYHINVNLSSKPAGYPNHFESLGDIEPMSKENVPYSKLNIGLPNYITFVRVDVEGISSIVLSEEELEGCNEILFIKNNGAIEIRVSGGDCFKRMR